MRKPKYIACCLTNGCQWYKGGITQRDANSEATSHLNVYKHDVHVGIDTFWERALDEQAAMRRRKS